MFFLLSSFLFCPPLKNDGRSELRYGVTINDFFIRRKEYEMKAVPAHGEGVNRQVDGRGKLEQTRETILTCVRKHAPIASLCSALPSVFGGS